MSLKHFEIHSVAACCNNWGIGVNGKLPWRLRKEMDWFSSKTKGNPPEGKQNAVIMGRKNWDSIPKGWRPMKKRYNIVFSRTLPLDFKGPDAIVRSLDGLIHLLNSPEWEEKIHEVYNIGGHDIYKMIQESPYCGKVYLTRILADYQCDTFFPKLDETFILLPEDSCPDTPKGIQLDNDISWKVEVYQRKPV